MTQFLLVASDSPYTEFPNIAFFDAQEASFLSTAATALFPNERKPIWNASPPGNEVGDLIYEARGEIHAGGSIENTELGRLLCHAMGKRDSFALFYGSDFDSLPIATSPQSLLEAIEEQLQVENGSNLELYVRWRPDA